LAYVWTGLRHVNGAAAPLKIKIDGTKWFSGEASCVLMGNVGVLAGGVPAFPDARPDDGRLDIGVATARGPIQWARALSSMSAGHADSSPFIRTTRARRISVKLGAAMPYELDGGARDTTTRIKARVVAGAVSVCVPDLQE
jgi:diacylglycerol kinase family enzyme